MKKRKVQQKIAEEIIRRMDTVILTTCEEVTNIHQMAQDGEFDYIFDKGGLGESISWKL